jgi:hypothetical protein
MTRALEPRTAIASMVTFAEAVEFDFVDVPDGAVDEILEAVERILAAHEVSDALCVHRHLILRFPADGSDYP